MSARFGPTLIKYLFKALATSVGLLINLPFSNFSFLIEACAFFLRWVIQSFALILALDHFFRIVTTLGNKNRLFKNFFVFIIFTFSRRLVIMTNTGYTIQTILFGNAFSEVAGNPWFHGKFQFFFSPFAQWNMFIHTR